ncbi:hypothetical protein EYF80_051626 [Liparis tanakae]|uniref:Uncharacterized protein n=1 Tax=Liparis tanakae TaxID=230148 RepID=A0A4Z2FBE1_9TELE|nr:hypothetical protein EYF80_051626 [Liparis tanakae]
MVSRDPGWGVKKREKIGSGAECSARFSSWSLGDDLGVFCFLLFSRWRKSFVEDLSVLFFEDPGNVSTSQSCTFKTLEGMPELDFRPTTSRRSDKFILAVTSPLLSPVCNIKANAWASTALSFRSLASCRVLLGAKTEEEEEEAFTYECPEEELHLLVNWAILASSGNSPGSAPVQQMLFPLAW